MKNTLLTSALLLISLVTSQAFAQDFVLDEQGILTCESTAVGDTATVYGNVYIAVDRVMLDSLIAADSDPLYVCTSHVDDMQSLFQNKQNFNQDIGNWDVSNVTEMNHMFFNSTSFNQDIGNWDVSKVTGMFTMFSGATSFNQNLTNWCVPLVTYFPRGFTDFSSFERENLPRWGTCAGKPGLITNIAPSYNNPEESIYPKFLWFSDSSATEYQLQILEEDKTIVLDTLVTDTTFSTKNPLTFNKNYSWRVRRVVEEDRGDWNGYWYFSTNIGIPERAQLISPSNNAIVDGSIENKLVWANSYGTTKFKLQFSDDPSFKSVILDSIFIAPDTSYLITTDLAVYGSYFWKVQASNDTGFSKWSDTFTFSVMGGLPIEEETTPSELTLKQNFPNPFNPTTIIQYSIRESTNVSLKVYNILGQNIATLVNGVKPAGNYSVVFDAATLTSGIYFYQLVTDNTVLSKRMILLK